jgi:hypothetical protein
MKNTLIENLFNDYESSLRLNAKLVASILAMTKALLETNEVQNVVVADLLITDLHKHFSDSKLIQQNLELFQSLIDLVEEIDADCQVKKLMHNI